MRGRRPPARTNQSLELERDHGFRYRCSLNSDSTPPIPRELATRLRLTVLIDPLRIGRSRSFGRRGTRLLCQIHPRPSRGNARCLIACGVSSR